MFINASLLWIITLQVTLPQNIMERCGIFVNYVWEFLKHKHENVLTYNWHYYMYMCQIDTCICN